MFEIVMGIDDFLIQLVKYCSWINGLPVRARGSLKEMITISRKTCRPQQAGAVEEKGKITQQFPFLNLMKDT